MGGSQLRAVFRLSDSLERTMKGLRFISTPQISRVHGLHGTRYISMLMASGHSARIFEGSPVWRKLEEIFGTREAIVLSDSIAKYRPPFVCEWDIANARAGNAVQIVELPSARNRPRKKS